MRPTFTRYAESAALEIAGGPIRRLDRESQSCQDRPVKKDRKEIAACLGIIARTVDNHLLAIRQKFRKQNMVAILRAAASLGILSPEELLYRDFEYPAFPLTDRTC
jgi:hypothetical protein